MKKLVFITLFALLAMFSGEAKAHCEIPCGIYGDSLRIQLLKEDIHTVEKSMQMVTQLSGETPVNYNQLVRWVTNKDVHATKIQDTATQYFMFQRIKLSDDPEQQKKNAKMLGLLHELCVYAMKAKQTTDLKYIGMMNDVVDKFAALYFEGAEHEHSH